MYSDEIKRLMCKELAEKKYGTVKGGIEGESMIKVMDDAKVVGCTCLSVGKDVLLAHKKFDVVIVDEAGQITQPAVLGALSIGKTFVLVGDHQQLPPIVKSELAREGGYNVSLLKRLAEANEGRIGQGQESSLTKLTMQYRMHEDIVLLCNEICYGGQLKCGNETVRFQKINYAEGWRGGVGGEGWLAAALDPSRAVTMVDTGLIGGDNSESRGGGERREGGGRGGRAIINDGEVRPKRAKRVTGIVA
jgi:DNA replication ATP-dependent helicase Dna2